MWPRYPSSTLIVSSVVVQLPGRPKLLAWICTGWGNFKLVGGLRHRADDLPRRDSEVVDGWSMSVDVARRTALPDFDAAGIDELGGVRLRRAQQPGDQAPCTLLRLVAAELPASGNGYCPSG